MTARAACRSQQRYPAYEVASGAMSRTGTDVRVCDWCIDAAMEASPIPCVVVSHEDDTFLILQAEESVAQARRQNVAVRRKRAVVRDEPCNQLFAPRPSVQERESLSQVREDVVDR